MVFIGGVVAEGGEEEGTEVAAFDFKLAEEVFFEEAEKEPLGEILGILGVMAHVAGEGVDRKPVVGAEGFEGLVGGGGGIPRGGETDEAGFRLREAGGPMALRIRTAIVQSHGFIVAPIGKYGSGICRLFRVIW